MERRAKGTGYLITNSDGTKTLRKTITNPNTGEQKRIQVTANSETACNKKMAAREKELEKLFKNSGVASNMTVAELCYNYLNYRYSNGSVVNGRFCPQSVRNFCPIVAGFNAGTYKVPACVL